MKNRKKLVQILAGVLVFVMIASLVLSILPTNVFAESSSEIRKEINALEEEQEGIWAQMDELEAQQNSNWNSIEEMIVQKDNIDQQISLLHAEIININEQITAYSLLIAEKQTELDEAQARWSELNEKNKARIQAMEEEGDLSIWSVLFKANSFTDLIDRLNMMEEIAAADERRLKAMDEAAKEVAQARDELEAEKVELEESRVQLEVTQEELSAKRAEADEMLQQLNEKKRELVAMYEEYEAMEAELSQQIAQREDDYDDAVAAEEEAARQAQANSGGSSSAPPSDGGWYQPCSYVALTSAYGWRIHPITGNESFHNGVDLANASGTPIYAAKSGTVTTATYNGVYGYYVTINHGDGFSTLYGHMTHYVVSEGEYVSGGQLIGYMGSTGWSTGPHLHFTIYYNGGTVNPMDYI